MAKQEPKLRRKVRGSSVAVDTCPIADGVETPRRITGTIEYLGKDGWTMTVVGRVDVIDGEPQLVHAEFDAPAGLPLGRLQREWVWSWLLEQLVGLHAVGRGGTVDDPRVQAVKAVQRSRTTRLVPAHLRQVARIYRKHQDDEPVKHVAAEMADRLGEAEVPYATARRWCYEARHRTDPATKRPYLETAR